jgi:hypothetical protein
MYPILTGGVTMEDTIEAMTLSLLEMMEGNGFAHNTIKVYEHSAFAPILHRYDKLGISSYDQCAMDGLAVSFNEQLESGLISKNLYSQKRKPMVK